MRVLVLLCLAVGALAVPTRTVSPVLGYHQNIGIPEAARIKAIEDRIHNGYDNSERSVSPRIVGGSIAATNSHPYLAGLLLMLSNIAGQSACGSVLVSANRLVTAAHCWFDGVNQAYQATVILGTNYLFYGGTRLSTTQVFMHPSWTPSTLDNDIAMIYLPSSVSFTATIQPIDLPTGTEVNNLFVGQVATAAGFGKYADSQTGVGTDSVIRQVNLQVIAENVCAASYTYTYVRATNMCTSGAGGVGICQGDSGGPLVITSNGRQILIGISSFTAQPGCQLGHPSAFTRVTSYVSYIQLHL